MHASEPRSPPSSDAPLLRTMLMRLALGAGVGLMLSLSWVKWQYGGGKPYPDLGTAAVLPESALEPLLEMDFPPGNVAASPDGRLFVNVHPFAQAKRFAVPTLMEWRDGSLQPYPSSAAQSHWQGVFGMTVDRQQRLWLIEPASLDHAHTRLTAIDLVRNARVFEHVFAEGEARFAQDLRVTPDGKTVILADTGLFHFTAPSLLVFDIASRRVLQRLAGHPSVIPQNWVMQTHLGQLSGPHRLGWGLLNFAVGVDGIELTPDGVWAVYAPMTHDTLYRVPIDLLIDPAVNESELSQAIETMGRKPMSDGITLDQTGRVILTDVEHGRLMRREHDGNVKTLAEHPDIIWADGVVRMNDGSLVFTDSAIPAYIDPLARPPALERLEAGRPYRVWRVRD